MSQPGFGRRKQKKRKKKKRKEKKKVRTLKQTHQPDLDGRGEDAGERVAREGRRGAPAAAVGWWRWRRR